jgi:hypothetical protein
MPDLVVDPMPDSHDAVLEPSFVSAWANRASDSEPEPSVVDAWVGLRFVDDADGEPAMDDGDRPDTGDNPPRVEHPAHRAAPDGTPVEDATLIHQTAIADQRPLTGPMLTDGQPLGAGDE